MKAYHFDKANALKEGQIIQLQQGSLAPIHLDELFKSHYSEGLSPHGISHYINPPSAILIIEILFEYERRLNFPHLLSRFQAFYACQDMDGIKKWFEKFPALHGRPVWEVEVRDEQPFFSGDSQWLDLGDEQNFVAAEFRARSYWEGKMTASPVPEILIKPPVQVLQKIDFSAS
ncbi:hypothetical protein VE23_24905 [Paenibacillus sp. D9]|uniref:DUF2441 domain-containing protein n=1 Tax=Paenibacillus sp. D9 TaxID=665792 RepID=UPI00061F2275|nr:DUF2441 domain-containing protein [Paenibacillus sp. D9]KKC49541.1 hypothetical protein VE23_24905 [Paenibacillus sp. D9]